MEPVVLFEPEKYPKKALLGPVVLLEPALIPKKALEMAVVPKEYSEETAFAIDNEIRRFVETGYKCAKKLLAENKDALDRVAKSLLERESLGKVEIEKLLRDEPLDPLPEPETAKSTNDAVTDPATTDAREESGKEDALPGGTPEGANVPV